MRQRIWLWAIFAFGVVGVSAQTLTVQVQPAGDATPGAEARVTLFALNRGAAPAPAPLPEHVAARLDAGEWHWTVELRRIGGAQPEIAAGAFAEAEYAFDVPRDASGPVVLALTAPGASRVVLDLVSARADEMLAQAPALPSGEGAAKAGKDETTKPGKPTTSGVPIPAIARIHRAFADHFSPHQPIYFIFGPNNPAAKFQFSFKYRMVSDSVIADETVQPLRGLYFAYTQRSLWSITQNSSPFYDSSYMPELFFERLEPTGTQTGGGLHWLGYQGGFMHESNGRDGPSSRSLNIAYVRPMLLLGQFDGWNLILAPRVFAYVGGLSDNPQMANYRGHVEWNAFFGKNDSVALAATGRTGQGFHKGSLQLDLTFPLKSKFGNVATFILLQYFTGFGEDLLSYDERSETVRAGFSLVR